MIFKKYYCAKCGATLEKERTLRVVTQHDPDYFRYHSYSKFPRRDYDVYEHQFKCPNCDARTSFDEQCILARIQKLQGYKILSSAEIKSNYPESEKHHRAQVLLQCILLPVVYALIAFGLYYIANPDRPTKDLWSVGLFLVIAAVVMAVRSIIYRKKTK